METLNDFCSIFFALRIERSCLLYYYYGGKNRKYDNIWSRKRTIELVLINSMITFVRL